MIGSPPFAHQAQKKNLELGTLKDSPVSFFYGRPPGRGDLAQRREAVWIRVLESRA